MPRPRIALFFPSYVWPDTHKTDPLENIRACIERAEFYGYDIWVIDHLLVAPGLYGATWLDPLSILNYAAALTKHVSLGTAILVAPVRQPVLLAKEIASLQLLSEGRFKLGVGPGWYAKEFEAVGHNIRERGRRTDEIIESLQLLFGQETASFHGRHYKFDDITMVPRVKMPELWVSGGSRVPDPNEHDLPIMAETVKHRIVKAGKWLARASGTFEWMERDWAELRACAKSMGKDPESLEFGMCNFFHLVDTKNEQDALALQAPHFERVMGSHRSIDWLQKGYLLGTTSQIVDRLQRAASVGCSYFILGPTSADPAQIDKLAKDVAPYLT